MFTHCARGDGLVDKVQPSFSTVAQYPGVNMQLALTQQLVFSMKLVPLSLLRWVEVPWAMSVNPLPMIPG